MSLKVDNSQLASTAHPSSDVLEKPLEDAFLAAAARGLGMDPDSENELLRPDANFLKVPCSSPFIRASVC